MRRGIIRIVSGIVLLVLQLLAMIGASTVGMANVTGSIGFYLGFYSPGITGILLLIFGCRAFRNKVYSKLILHTNSSKVHTITKWVGFSISTLLLIRYLMEFIFQWPNFDLFVILSFFGFLSFSAYTLFYMYKKPSCLFSAAMIFIGAACLYGLISRLSYYIIYFYDQDYFIPYIFTYILPTFAAGILYIVIASILHLETFSVQTIKILGWTVFALEILSGFISRIFIQQSFYFPDLEKLLYLLFVVVLMLYLSVFKVNTLKGDGRTYNIPPNPPSHAAECMSCGYRSAIFLNTCPNCGQSAKTYVPLKEEPPSDVAKICFCRKCGEKLIDNSRFCSKCGTEIVDCQKGID